MIFSSILKLPMKYTLGCHLWGHQDAILCLVVSNSGTLLASGGFDGLRVWDLCKEVQLPQPLQMRSPKDPITTITWLAQNDSIQETLCCGTGLGYLLIWRQRPHTVVEFKEVVARRISGGHEIMAIASDAGNSTGTHIVVMTRDKRVQTWTIDSRNRLSNVFSVELTTSIPHAVYLRGCDIIVFGMYDGDINNGMVIETRSTGMTTGSACVDKTGSLFIIDNAISGFSLHRLNDGSCIRTYDTKPLKTYPKQVAFVEDGTTIIGGSDNGLVYIFEMNTGTKQQVLQHSRTARTQTITTYDREDHTGIVAASSNNDMDNTITVWKKPKRDLQLRPGKKESSLQALFRAIRATIQFLMQLLTIAFAVKLTYNVAVSYRLSNQLNTD
ncbi:hypothetical protein M404DRAFT_156911 [Pisolithus tinctorius Marx 270]|uniref:Anaphase-promoting complex subunit 4 WD40 domain-containing protein n=1 Tax=Pisolithus tinctorius Marx 270 TaxID=870435 RepID=A0A0C3JMM4_PISTI|nr:hypothetical protein M404DRAFT_156911 [Pisolithus tinctorius Marx 270]